MLANIIVGAIVFGGIIFAAYKTFKAKKDGASCGCGCSGCGKSADSCKK
ncbi:FeoB-associated Cys-rich membrane protein [Anaerocolumna xylanovorans]|uniref:Virus attachment protein p12 family protein n=1 Tax=Anaerocolumna xylanovorans DSM 12503 TaxID=1121345 RepID=A0A1M7Y0D7_9FIRM|nr:FeoB-associated Cys-rich membrane protein [Anaerocolumna xylanovorans]SHO44988.1 Virus attachment protein p12 family protein [Anaerocolumna xylanovorans DSM 12503]